MTTEILNISELQESQASKYITHNTALRQIEGRLVRVMSRTNSGPPGSPSNGDTYIVDSATGDWLNGTVGDIAHYYSDSWHFYTPAEGLVIWVNDEDLYIKYTGSEWVTTERFEVNSESLSGTKTLAATDPQIQALDPNGANRNVLLPPEADGKGMWIFITNTGTGGYDLTVYDDSQTTQIAALGNDQAKIFVCDGTEWTTLSAGGGVSDHGALTGLADDDHSIYLLADGTRDLSKLVFEAPTELTISSGAVTATQGVHSIDTEGDASTGTLDTISGGGDGQVLLIRAENSARVVTLSTGGNISLEGDVVLATDRYTALYYDGTLTKWVVLGLDYHSHLDPSLATDHSYNGVVETGTVRESVSFGNLLYYDISETGWKVADKSAIGTMPVEGMALGSQTAGNDVLILRKGYVRDDSWSWTADDSVKILYCGSTGALTETPPDTAGHLSQAVATIRAATKIFFHPTPVLAEVSS
jgi:hypothetical protein